jgi:DNA-binding Xre family transcriptional regulator
VLKSVFGGEIMLRYNIKRVLVLRGIERPHSFLMKNGFASQTARNFMTNNVVHIKPAQIERLCVLLHCTPNDLYEWQPNASAPVAENHPLKELKREKPAQSFSQMVKDLPVEKMSELESIINELKSRE